MAGSGACIVQNDYTVLLDTNHPAYDKSRKSLSRFADLLKSPSSFHTYRITPLSLWNAAASGMTSEETLEELQAMSRFDIPPKVEENIALWMSRYGQLVLKSSVHEEQLILQALEPKTLDELEQYPSLSDFGLERRSPNQAVFWIQHRGALKMELTRLGYPVLDQAGYHSGHPLPMMLQEQLPDGRSFGLRPYQMESVNAFIGEANLAGSGVLVLPCGAGKTIIGLGVMQHLQCETLILTSNISSVRQWIAEIMDKSSLSPEQVGEYSGNRKQVRPVTVSTYQILTHRTRKEEGFRHLSLLSKRDWGLIIYDEVHLLPAPVFRATADIQAKRRLGLTATLVREDGREKDVFSLIGPVCRDIAWKELETNGWIAAVECTEIRVPMNPSLREQYHNADGRSQYRLAAENTNKLSEVQRLLSLHSNRCVLIIGQYIQQLRQLARSLNAPIITGRTTQEERSLLYAQFREGLIPVLIVSRVANFAIDLPDASVAIQVSGSFGSRQEEAQRLGRILRPKQGDNRAFFYTLVTEGTKEQTFAYHRQLFLVEQGYTYQLQQASSNCDLEVAQG